MLMYSARKNSANLNDEYSVWKPPTSSDSASGRSNGARLVSPTAEMEYSRKLGANNTANHPGASNVNPPTVACPRLACAATMSDVDIEPAMRNTATIDRPMATSYEIICALDRNPPSRG